MHEVAYAAAPGFHFREDKHHDSEKFKLEVSSWVQHELISNWKSTFGLPANIPTTF